MSIETVFNTFNLSPSRSTKIITIISIEKCMGMQLLRAQIVLVCACIEYNNLYYMRY